MTSRTIARRALFALPVVPALAAVALAAAPANAEDNDGGSFATTYAVAEGPCVGTVNAGVHGKGYPGMASFGIQTNLIGLGPCSLPVTLEWRNNDTGETGSVTQVANGPGYWANDGKSALFPAAGHGHYTGTVTLGTAHIPEPGTLEFAIPEYHP